MVFPTLPQSAQAEEAESKVSLSVAPVISLSLQDTVAVEVTPTQDGTFSSNTAALSISTNNETGYSLYMATGNGENTLTSQNPGISNVISAVNGGDNGVTSSNFGSNTWGYNLSQDSVSDTTAYKAVPTANGDTAIISISSPTEVDTYNLTFGTKVDTSLPSGTYSNDVVVSVVANPEYVPTISAMTNMQDVTAEICAASAEGETTTLIDTRDGSDYTVAKINGNCWMTQNLRLAGGTTLTTSNSNVTKNYTLPIGSLTSGNSDTEALSIISSDISYGGYYNYCAASAGTVCSQTEMTTTQDICPKGWRLPTYSEQSGITGVNYVSAFSPVYSGFYQNGLLRDAGSFGHWWSATAYGSNYQYHLYYYRNVLYTPSSDGFKSRGFSVRCIRSNPGTLTINFDGNGSDGGSTASQQIAAGNSASLNANGFTRNGYAFTGWNTAADGSGTSYADGDDYAVTPATGNTTVTLYAQWEAFGKDTMQGFTLSDCQQQASGGQVTLRDVRDNNTYTAQYINDTCWMTQNLRLAGGTQLNSTTSNVSSSYTLPADSAASGTFWAPDGSVHYSGNTNYGSYYDFCAASAGTRCGAYVDSDDYSEFDICPKGWRLPTQSEYGEILIDLLRGDLETSDAFLPGIAGYYYNGLYHDDRDGRQTWWASSLTTINLVTGHHEYAPLGTGLAIRCVRSS